MPVAVQMVEMVAVEAVEERMVDLKVVTEVQEVVMEEKMEDLEVCDWPNKAGCDKNGADDKPKPNPNGNKCESGCNILPWAHETECSKFWVCDGTKPVLGTCSEGLHFNPQTYTCDFICNVSCIRKNIMSSVQPDGLKIFLPWNKVDPDLIKRYLKKK
ncbi:hypothetical protein RR48_03201 [Papilio machaon]|uniref:Chitin-binding type-2 domain-containing protein n=1 Tax=Papilio machaon TaxID=76193 RepID=A0A0N1PHD1_PAPMA|nr:hypothetical protein RR48_03201 [Papilio machaon]